MLASACPLYDGSYQGHCDFCNCKTECLLTDILKRVKNMEDALAKNTTIAGEIKPGGVG